MRCTACYNLPFDAVMDQILAVVLDPAITALDAVMEHIAPGDAPVPGWWVALYHAREVEVRSLVDTGLYPWHAVLGARWSKAPEVPT